MKIIILLCIFSGLAQSSHHNGNDNCWKQCDPKDYIAVVTCHGEEGNVESCNCKKGLDDVDCAVEMGLLTGPLSWTECHKLTQDRGDQFPGSEFFRWEDMEIEVERETKTLQLCYILPAPCTGLPPGECRPYDGAPCVAGPSTEECEPAASEHCAAPVWNNEGIHWICAGPNGVVNAYTPGATIPKGTTCTTDKTECETWDWVDEGPHDGEQKIAMVQCGDNIWESNPAAKLLIDNSPVDENGLTIAAYQILPDLNDAVCRCPLLEISEATYATPGLSLLCDQGYNPLDGGIKYGNACTLLCDGHFKMYIECLKGQWKNTGADYPFADVTKEDINC